MQTTRLKKLWTGLLCLMLCALPLTGLAAQTTLAVNLLGLRADAEGQWQTEKLSGTFEVWTGDTLLGTVNANPEDGRGASLLLQTTQDVYLKPVMDKMPEGYLIDEGPISVSVSAGKENRPPVLVYADAGLFTVQGEIGAAFSVLNAEGEFVLDFELDEMGAYTLPLAMQSGDYVLHQTAAAQGRSMMPDQPFTLTAYKGDPESVLHLTADNTVTPEPTAAPTSELTTTPEMTDIPTETPETADKTQEAATEAQTFTPEPTTVPTNCEIRGTVTCEGAGLAGVTVALGNGVTAVTDAQGAFALTKLAAGEYLLTFTPANTLYVMDTPAQQVTVGGDQPETAELAVTAHAVSALRLTSGIAASYTVTLTQGEATVQSAACEDQMETLLTGLEPGDYTVTLTLPEYLLLTQLNGTDTAWLRETAQWNVTLLPGQESLYQMTLVQGGNLTGAVDGLADGTLVTASNDSYTVSATVQGGQYALLGLVPGSYTVSIALPDAGYTTGEGWYGLATETQYQATCTAQVNAGSTATIPTLTRPQNADLSGYAYVDANDNGMMDAGETVVPGMTAALVNTENAIITTTTTDAAGQWRFENVPAGDWRVTLTAPEGLALLGSMGAYSLDGTNTSAVIALRGMSETELNVPLTQPGSLMVNVFIDANSNGECGLYERHLAGVVLEVLRSEEVAATATTDEEGNASFTTLAPGTYQLRATLPAGYGFGKKGKELRITSNIMEQSSELTQTSQELTLTKDAPLKVGIGVNTMAKVTGSIWLDDNANGIWNNGETGYAGVTVTLTGEKNGLTYTTQSAADGTYVLDQVRAGSYKLSVTCPDGLMFTRYSATGREMRSIITAEGRRTAGKSIVLEPGDVLEKQHVGLMREAVIEGVAFLDSNYDGLYNDGDLPLAGVKIEVIKLNGDTVGSVESAEDGSFRVAALRANEYRIRAVLPKGDYTFTTTVDAETEGNWFKARAGRRENTVEGVTLQAGENRRVLVGAIQPGAISGTCYLDNNFSATMDKGEKVVSGLTIRLLDENGTVVETARTNGKGVYTFEDLTPGTYQLSMDAKAGYAFTRLGEQNVFVNQSAGAGQTETFYLSLGEQRTDMDAGMILPGVVEGRVFADANDNGLLDAEETGLAGTVVQLVSDTEVAFETTLDETGAYCFDAVMPGRYCVRYQLPENTVFAAVKAEGNTVSGTDNVGESEWFDFATAQQQEMPLVGGVTLGCVSGTVFEDHNGDGVQGADEITLAGAELRLIPHRSDLEEASVVTAADGSFAFEGLHPDTYTLQVTLPEGDVLTRKIGYTLPLTPGENDQRATLTLAMGDRYEAQQLGAVMPAQVTGVLWLDENNDGRMDASERTPAGKTITVVDEDTGTVFAKLTTDEQGAFAVRGLVPGNYTFRYALDEQTLAAPAGDSTFTQVGSHLQQAVTVQEGDSVSSLKLGVVMYTSLGGQVWLDRAGVMEPVVGAHVLLTDANGAQVALADSAEDGTYRFNNLMPGTYYLAATLPEGYLVVEPDDARLTEGGHTSVLVQTNGQSGQSDKIVLRMAEDQLHLDMGSVLPGSLGDQAWLDLNGNGVYDSDEPGLPGVTVRLLRNGTVAHETVTNAYGYYLFKDVYPSAYTLEVVYPAEVKPTQQGSGLLTSILPASDADTVQLEGVQVESDVATRTADMGFVLRQAGVYPAGVGDAPTQDWSK